MSEWTEVTKPKHKVQQPVKILTRPGLPPQSLGKNTNQVLKHASKSDATISKPKSSSSTKLKTENNRSIVRPIEQLRPSQGSQIVNDFPPLPPRPVVGAISRAQSSASSVTQNTSAETPSLPATVPTPAPPVAQAPSKPKPSSLSLALFDLVLTPKKKLSQRERREIAAASITPVLIPDPITPDPPVVVRKRKKKKLSVLKRKVLLERLAAHILTHGAPQSTDTYHSRTIYIKNLLSAEAFEDVDELHEVLENSRTLLGAFRCAISRVSYCRAKDYYKLLPASQRETDEEDWLVFGQFGSAAGLEREEFLEREDDTAATRLVLPHESTSLPIEVTRPKQPDSNREAARLAVRGIDGLVLGGDKLQARSVPLDVEAATWELLSRSPHFSNENPPQSTVAARSPVAVLHIEGVLVQEDVEDCDEAMENLKDLMRLSATAAGGGNSRAGAGTITSCWLQFTGQEAEHDDDGGATAAAAEDDPEYPVSACVAFSSIEAALAARNALHNVLVGGKKVFARVEEGNGSPCLASDNESANQPIIAMETPQTAPITPAIVLPRPKAEQPESKYKAAKIAPKQPKRTADTHSTLPATIECCALVEGSDSLASVPSVPTLTSHPTPTATPDIDTLIKSLLQSVSSLQSAALVDDSASAKNRKPFVLGLKQCTNAVKSQNARLVLLPPDTERSDAIDKMVQTLLDAAAACEPPVPVVYCLSRRRLGKALSNAMRQSAAVVCSTQGIEEAYTQLLAWWSQEKLTLESTKTCMLAGSDEELSPCEQLEEGAL